jgi:hypothetical protein
VNTATKTRTKTLSTLEDYLAEAESWALSGVSASETELAT